MERQFFSGNTIEQAVLAAARHYGVEPERVSYTLRDKKHGFLNVRRRVVIEVDPSAPEIAESPPTAPSPAPSAKEATARDARPDPESPPAPGTAGTAGHPGADDDPDDRFADDPDDGFADDDLDDSVGDDDQDDRFVGDDDQDDRSVGDDDQDDRFVGDGVWHHWKAVSDEFAEENEGEEDQEIVAFEKALDEVLELMDLDLEWSVERQDEAFEIDLEGEDEDLLVEDDGRLLRSIEHLLPRLVRGLLGYGLPCKVDCGDFHASRDLELRELAEGVAELVRRQGKEQILEPMNPADRRTVHLALAEDPTVSTESEGDGYMKRVRILPG